MIDWQSFLYKISPLRKFTILATEERKRRIFPDERVW